MSVRVPDELKERMARFDAVNWSAVIRAHIQEELDVTVCDASYVALAAAVGGLAFTADATLLSAVDGTEYADRLEHTDGYG